MNHSTSSGKKLGSAQIASFTGALCGIDVLAPDTGSVIVYIYDSENSSTSGKNILAELHVDAGLMGMNHEFTRPVNANRGIYAEMIELGGTGSSFIVRYFLG